MLVSSCHLQTFYAAVGQAVACRSAQQLLNNDDRGVVMSLCGRKLSAAGRVEIHVGNENTCR
jgi:hypothetical protein